MTQITQTMQAQFDFRRTYTRDQIHNLLGGETQTYLPQRGNQIVCGCFDQSENPKAPDEILVALKLKLL